MLCCGSDQIAFAPASSKEEAGGQIIALCQAFFNLHRTRGWKAERERLPGPGLPHSGGGGGALSPQSCRWHFWITGFCGGYTTFSTFSWQVLDLVRAGEGTLAGAYAAGSIAFGMLAVWFGLSLAMHGHNNT